MNRTILIGILILLPAFAVLAGSIGTPSSPTDYVGATRCQECHPRVHAQWLNSPHANAQKSLDEKQVKDPKCLQCHTLVPSDTTGTFSGVQCESCHGPGRYYSKRYVMRDKELSRLVGLKDVKPTSCEGCHNHSAPNIRPFDAKKAWEQIARECQTMAKKGPTTAGAKAP